jgi:phage terminase small subunit
MALTNKQRAFIRHYLECWNAAEAARRAGYSDRSCGAIGRENIRKPTIKAEIDAAIEEKLMTRDEALTRMGEIARGEYARYIIKMVRAHAVGDNTINVDEVGIDIDALISDGKAHLIKSISPTRYGQRIEFYDMQSALETILKATGAFETNVNLNTNTDQILVIGGVKLEDV